MGDCWEMKLVNYLAMLVIVYALPLKAATSLDYPSIWNCDEQNKFNWYCDKTEDEPKPEGKPSPVPANAESKRVEINDLKTAEEMRRELKRREDQAVMIPSEQNIKDYLELWKVVQQKGTVFADNWRRVVWQNADLDYSTQRSMNNSAIKTYDEQREVQQEEKLKTLAANHGLIFFFRSDCPYCKAEAPVIKSLAERYGLDILAVSTDGGTLPEFPNAVDGRAKATSWGIDRVPAIFLGSKETGDRAAIGFGQLASTEIINRIFVLTSTKAGQTF
jgi:conjugal transfer pilus assembly protein TraF